MRLLRCAILAVALAGCAAEEAERPEPARDLGPRLFAIGAYIGEIIRRSSEGWKWVPAKGDPTTRSTSAYVASIT